MRNILIVVVSDKLVQRTIRLLPLPPPLRLPPLPTREFTVISLKRAVCATSDASDATSATALPPVPALRLQVTPPPPAEHALTAGPRLAECCWSEAACRRVAGARGREEGGVCRRLAGGVTLAS